METNYKEIVQFVVNINLRYIDYHKAIHITKKHIYKHLLKGEIEIDEEKEKKIVFL